MKKLFALVLAVMMIATMSTTAFAAEGNGTVGENNGSQTINVSGTYAAGGELEAVVSVAISWGSMEFTYTAGDQTWDPANHVYTAAQGTWSCAEGANIITVVNHSNTGVEVKASFASSVDGVTGKVYISRDGAELTQDNIAAAASAGWYGTPNAPSRTFTVDITGGSINADTDNLGTVTLTIKSIGVVKNND